MSPLIAIGVCSALLFASAYVTKRRFGILGLALAGGAILAGLWSETVGLLFEIEDIAAGTLTSENLAVVFITIFPAVLLLLRGPKYHSSLLRLGSSVLFVLFALALVVGYLQSSLTTSDIGSAVYVHILRFRELIITGGLVAAFIDVFFMKTSSKLGKSGSKH